MIICVFGNPDLKEDSLPIRILPRLQEKFPEIEFKHLDPNEDWEIPENLVVIDTVVGINDVLTFSKLEYFSNPPRVSMHDFDALSYLKYLKKLGKIKKIKIIGLPPTIAQEKALKQVSLILRSSKL